MLQLFRSVLTDTRRVLAASISTGALLLLSSGASAQCQVMTFTGHSPGYGTTVSSLSNPPLWVSFTYDVDPTSLNADINSGNVRLYEASNSSAKVAIAATAVGKNVYIKPLSPLKPFTTYRYVVSSGIKAKPQSCGTPAAFSGSHGNNWSTSSACGGPDMIGTPLTLLKGCTYSLDYRNDYLLNVNADYLTEKVTLGTFSYTRGANPSLSGAPYSSYAPDMYDFGLAVKMTNIHFDATRNQWIADTVTVTGYNDNGSGGSTLPVLNTYNNIAVASGTGAFPYTRKITHEVYGQGVIDITNNYSTSYPYTAGTVSASGTPLTCTPGSTGFLNAPITLQQLCNYEITYTNDYFLNVNADYLTEKVTLGSFVFSRGADPSLQGQYYGNFVPDMYDFGLSVKMSGVHYESATNRWMANTVTVTGYNDNGSGGFGTPVLKTYSNIQVAGSNGSFGYARKVTNQVYNPSTGTSQVQDISANYPTSYPYTTGVAVASKP